jgi:hypothetical protein
MDSAHPEPPAEIRTTKQLAAVRQITAAIEHLYKRDFECAITLAAAAESLLPPTADPHLFQSLKEYLPAAEFKELNVNRAVNRLKHYNLDDPDPVTITEVDAVMALQRAITKFIAVYHRTTQQMEDLFGWARDKGHLVVRGKTTH